MRKSNFNFLTAFLLIFLPCITFSATEDSLENPMFDDVLFSYFMARPRVRVDISVQDATGKGEKILDFFIVEDKRIPRNLNEIIQFVETRKTPTQAKGFLSIALESLMKSNSSGALAVVESLSEPGKSERLSSFVVVHAKDFSRLQGRISSAAESVASK